MEIWSAEEKEQRRIAIEKINPDNRNNLSDERSRELKVLYQAIREFENPRLVYERRAKEAARKLPTGHGYQSYLKSKAWEQKRVLCLSYYRYKCGVCYSKDNLEVHHRTYKRIFNEDPSDLIVLCHDCHSSYHMTAQEIY